MKMIGLIAADDQVLAQISPREHADEAHIVLDLPPADLEDGPSYEDSSYWDAPSMAPLNAASTVSSPPEVLPPTVV